MLSLAPLASAGVRTPPASRCCRNLQAAGILARKPLHVAHPVVGQVADRAAREARQARDLDRALRLEQAPKRRKRVALWAGSEFASLDSGGALNLERAGPRDEADACPKTHETQAAAALALLGRFEQERSSAVVELSEQADRGFEIR